MGDGGAGGLVPHLMSASAEGLVPLNPDMPRVTCKNQSLQPRVDFQATFAFAQTLFWAVCAAAAFVALPDCHCSVPRELAHGVLTDH